MIQSKSVTVTHVDMGMTEFLSIVIPFTAWPLACVLILFIFRRPISTLLLRIKEVNIAGNKIGLGEQIKEAESLLETGIGKPVEDIDLGQPSGGNTDSDSDANNDADTDADADGDANISDRDVRVLPMRNPNYIERTPLDIINTEWFKADTALREIAKFNTRIRSHPSDVENMPIESILDQLIAVGQINPAQRTFFTQLSAIQQTAARLGRATVPDARSFERLARIALKWLGK